MVLLLSSLSAPAWAWRDDIAAISFSGGPGSQAEAAYNAIGTKYESADQGTADTQIFIRNRQPSASHPVTCEKHITKSKHFIYYACVFAVGPGGEAAVNEND